MLFLFFISSEIDLLWDLESPKDALSCLKSTHIQGQGQRILKTLFEKRAWFLLQNNAKSLHTKAFLPLESASKRIKGARRAISFIRQYIKQSLI